MEAGMIWGVLCLFAGISGMFLLLKGMFGKESRDFKSQARISERAPSLGLDSKPHPQIGNSWAEKEGEPEEGKILELRNKLLHLERNLLELEANRPYEKLFDQAALPLQSLLGLAHTSWDSLPAERAKYYMWEVTAEPILAAVRHGKGELSEGKLVLPVKEILFDEEAERKNIERYNERELEVSIWEDEQKLKIRNTASQKKGVVEELGWVVERLRNCQPDGPVEKAFVEELAEEVQKNLEKNGIYPMFARDKKLEDYTQLRRDFIPLNRYSIRYPGLFIRREKHWEVLGANIGMDDWEA